MADRAERLRKQLEMLEAEESFVAAKTAYAAGDLDAGGYRRAKADLRAFRESHRKTHRGAPPVGVAAEAETVKVKTAVKKAG